MKPTNKIWQRTPISYYGGKQTMLPYILPLIPKHEVYTEAFFGGGAVFWAKEKVKIEIINDFNANVYTFYKVLQTRFAELQALVKQSIVSREAYKAALVIYHAPFAFTEVQRAWAFWYAANCGYSNQVGNCRITTNSKNVSVLNNKIANFTDIYSARLQNVQIDNTDACEVISLRDTPNTFHYIDPPYVGAKQGHYGGYEQEHFNELLHTLTTVKGKFLLSSYPNEKLTEYLEQYGWYQREVSLSLGSSNRTGRKRTEVLTTNYLI